MEAPTGGSPGALHERRTTRREIDTPAKKSHRSAHGAAPRIRLTRSPGSQRSGSSGWLLVDPEDIAARIAEASGDLGRVPADWLDDLAAMGGDGRDRCRCVVDHDVDEKSGLRR